MLCVALVRAVSACVGTGQLFVFACTHFSLNSLRACNLFCNACIFAQHASDLADIDSLRDELATARADGRATKAALDAARAAAEAQSAELNRVCSSEQRE
jgi:hypothetical protein